MQKARTVRRESTVGLELSPFISLYMHNAGVSAPWLLRHRSRRGDETASPPVAVVPSNPLRCYLRPLQPPLRFASSTSLAWVNINDPREYIQPSSRCLSFCRSRFLPSPRPFHFSSPLFLPLSFLHSFFTSSYLCLLHKESCWSTNYSNLSSERRALNFQLCLFTLLAVCRVLYILS